MTRFEEQLTEALVRREPPGDFVLRVLTMAANQPKLTATARLSLWLHRTWRLAPVMAALLVLSGGAVYEQHERATRGEAAKHQLLMAMRIAGSKLHRAQHRVFGIETAEVSR